MSDVIVSWFYDQGGTRKGPFTPDEIAALIRAGAVDEHTRMWSGQLGEWMPLFRTELRSLLGEKLIQPPPLPPQRSSVQPSVNPEAATQSQYGAPEPATNHLAATPRFAHHAYPPPQNYPLYDNQILGKVLFWLIRVNAFISGGEVILIFKNRNNLEKQYQIMRALEGDEWSAIVAIPFLVTMVAFLWWKYRSTSNLFRLLGPQTITPAGAVYWYFVPVAWFWKPYEAMSNLCNGYGVGDPSGLRLWWSLLWGGVLAAAIVAAIVPDPIQTSQQAQIYIWGSVATYIIDAVWCWTAAELVKVISAAEAEALKRI